MMNPRDEIMGTNQRFEYRTVRWAYNENVVGRLCESKWQTVECTCKRMGWYASIHGDVVEAESL